MVIDTSALSRTEILRRLALGYSLWDDDLLDIGRRGPKKQRSVSFDGDSSKQIGSSFKSSSVFGGRQIDWSIISRGMADHRPTSSSGSTTFHFAFNTVHAGDRAMPPADHDDYITRKDAVEAVRNGKELLGNGASAGASFSRGLTYVTDSIAEDAAILSNIGATPERRRSYWRAIEKTSRQASTAGNVRIHLSKLGREAIGMECIATAPEFLQSSLKCARDALQRPHDGSLNWAQAPIEVPLDRKDVVEANKWLAASFGKARKGRPITVNPPRPGVIQYRLVGELPDCIDSRARARILKKIVTELGSMGFMYTAAAHAPDAANDFRNNHFHLMFHDQPGCWLDELKCWDFAHIKRDTRHGRDTFPLAKARVGYATRIIPRDKERSGTRFVGYMRRKLAEFVNVELARRHSALRYDPRSFEKIGIDRIPERHLGPTQAKLEAAGVPTVTGAFNAAAYWYSEFWAVSSKAKRDIELADARASRAELEARSAAQGMSSGFDFAGPISAVRANARALAEAEADLSMLKLAADRARSRPANAVLSVTALLNRIRDGSARKSEIKSLAAIEARLRDATTALASVDRQIAKGEPIVGRQRRLVGRLKLQLAGDDARLVDIVRQAKAIRDRAAREMTTAALLVAQTKLTAAPAHKPEALQDLMISKATMASEPQMRPIVPLAPIIAPTAPRLSTSNDAKAPASRPNASSVGSSGVADPLSPPAHSPFTGNQTAIPESPVVPRDMRSNASPVDTKASKVPELPPVAIKASAVSRPESGVPKHGLSHASATSAQPIPAQSATSAKRVGLVQLAEVTAVGPETPPWRVQLDHARQSGRWIERGRFDNETQSERQILDAGGAAARHAMDQLETDQAREFGLLAEFIAALTRDKPPVRATVLPDGSKQPVRTDDKWQLDDRPFDEASPETRKALQKWRNSSRLQTELNTWVCRMSDSRRVSLEKARLAREAEHARSVPAKPAAERDDRVLVEAKEPNATKPMATAPAIAPSAEENWDAATLYAMQQRSNSRGR